MTEEVVNVNVDQCVEFKVGMYCNCVQLILYSWLIIYVHQYEQPRCMKVRLISRREILWKLANREWISHFETKIYKYINTFVPTVIHYRVHFISVFPTDWFIIINYLTSLNIINKMRVYYVLYPIVGMAYLFWFKWQHFIGKLLNYLK